MHMETQQAPKAAQQLLVLARTRLTDWRSMTRLKSMTLLTFRRYTLYCVAVQRNRAQCGCKGRCGQQEQERAQWLTNMLGSCRNRRHRCTAYLHGAIEVHAVHEGAVRLPIPEQAGDRLKIVDRVPRLLQHHDAAAGDQVDAVGARLAEQEHLQGREDGGGERAGRRGGREMDEPTLKGECRAPQTASLPAA